MKLDELGTRQRGVLVGALTAEVLRAAKGEIRLEELDSRQRGVLLDVLTAHLAELKARYAQTSGLRHISEGMLMGRLAIIDADVQVTHGMINQLKSAG